MREKLRQAKIMAVLNHRESPCRVWRNNVGAYETASGGWIQYGLGVGSADLIGLVIGTGQFLGIEIKTPVGRLSAEQRAWLAAVEKMGGITRVLRTEDEAREFVKWLREAG